MKFKITLVALVVCTAFIYSCKDEDSSTPAKTKTDLLTTGSWIGTDLLANDTSIWNIFVSSCSKDDFTKYNSNGTSLTDEGATKCDPSDPQTEAGTWKFISNDTKIVMDGSDTADILELSETALRIGMSDGTDKLEARFKQK